MSIVGFNHRFRTNQAVGARAVVELQLGGAAEARGVDVADLTDDEFTQASQHLTPEVREVLTVEGALASRSTYGGTAPVRVREQLVAARAAVEDASAVWD